MFDEVHGLPLHPLAVHAAVVSVPLAALLGILFAIPKTRAWSRWPLLLVSLGAVGAVYVAKQSGHELEHHLNLQGVTLDLITEHAKRANLLFTLVIIFAVIAVVAFVLTQMRNVNNVLVTGVSVLLVIGAVAVAFQTYRVGDIGSKAVWNPTGDVKYGSSSN